MQRVEIHLSEVPAFLRGFDYSAETGAIWRRNPNKTPALHFEWHRSGVYWVRHGGQLFHAGAVAWLLYHNEPAPWPVEFVHRIEPPRLDNLYLYAPEIPVYRQSPRNTAEASEQARRIEMAREQQAAFRAAGRVDLAYLDPLG